MSVSQCMNVYIIFSSFSLWSICVDRQGNESKIWPFAWHIRMFCRNPEYQYKHLMASHVDQSKSAQLSRTRDSTFDLHLLGSARNTAWTSMFFLLAANRSTPLEWTRPMLQPWAVVRQGIVHLISSLIFWCLFSLDSSACQECLLRISDAVNISQQGKRKLPQEKGRNCPATLLKEGWETVLEIRRVRQPPILESCWRVFDGLGTLWNRHNSAKKSEQMLFYNIFVCCWHFGKRFTLSHYFVSAVLSVLNNLQRTSANYTVAFCLYII